VEQNRLPGTGVPDRRPEPNSGDGAHGGRFIMLWTILVVLAIVALLLFVLGRARGGRGL
jgi:hypothetical protein